MNLICSAGANDVLRAVDIQVRGSRASRSGGALIVHTTERAGYPWHTVVGSWAKEQRMLPRDPNLPAPLGVRMDYRQRREGFAHTGRARSHRSARKRSRVISSRCPRAYGGPLVPEHRRAFGVGERRRDRPRSRSGRARSIRCLQLALGPSGVARRSTATRSTTVRSTMPPASQIFRGRAGRAAIASASPFSPLRLRDRRGVGLLGSEYFGQYPLAPADKIVANINVNGGNILGRVRVSPCSAPTSPRWVPPLVGCCRRGVCGSRPRSIRSAATSIARTISPLPRSGFRRCRSAPGRISSAGPRDGVSSKTRTTPPSATISRRRLSTRLRPDRSSRYGWYFARSSTSSSSCAITEIGWTSINDRTLIVSRTNLLKLITNIL